VSKDGFLIAEGFICAEDSEIFKKDPLQLLRVFELMQRHDAQLDVDLALLVYDSLELLDEASALSPAAQKILREILRRKGKVARALGAMHTCGVLSKVLPEFAKLTCLVQHEHYHRYTVDIHTLSTIAQLDKLFLDEVPYAEVYRQQLEKLRAPWILYPTLLLHDVGKAVGIKGHSHESVVIAEPVLTRLGLSAPERQLALFVIGHHMEMSRACLRYDVDDPLTAKAFARMVGDKEKLRALFIHTFCDSNGTSATLWNGYKQALHTRLFSATLQRLGSQGQPSKALEQAKARLSERLGASGQLADLSAEEIAAHFDLMPDGYFANAQDADVLRHLQMTHELFVQMSGASEKATLMPVLHWQHDKAAGLSHLDIVTWDRTGLFYRLAGALAASGINILGTRAHSRADCITIDTFTVCEAHGGAVLSEHTRARFEKALAQSLLEGEDLLPAIELQAEKISKTFFSREKPVRGKVKTKVSLHYEDALEQNILEVRANDRLGLLYTIAREISLSGFDISFARITTERGIALDTFYISPTDPDTPAPSKETLDALRERLTQTLEANK